MPAAAAMVTVISGITTTRRRPVAPADAPAEDAAEELPFPARTGAAGGEHGASEQRHEDHGKDERLSGKAGDGGKAISAAPMVGEVRDWG